MRIIASFISLGLLAGCATAPTEYRVRADASCSLMRLRTYSINDTLQSIEYRRQDNASACTCPENKQKPECKGVPRSAGKTPTS